MNINKYYKILNCNINDDITIIKKNFRRLLLKWHPDKNNNSEESVKLTREIIEAYKYILKYKFNDNNDYNFEYEYKRNDSYDLIPKKFREMGFTTFPTVDQYVRRCIEINSMYQKPVLYLFKSMHILYQSFLVTYE